MNTYMLQEKVIKSHEKVIKSIEIHRKLRIKKKIIDILLILIFYLYILFAIVLHYLIVI